MILETYRKRLSGNAINKTLFLEERLNLWNNNGNLSKLILKLKFYFFGNILWRSAFTSLLELVFPKRWDIITAT